MILDSIKSEFIRYKTLAERAFEQLPDQFLNKTIIDGSNSVATLFWHLSGNLKSRYSDFLVPGVDGEKPWRDHAGEFVGMDRSREELITAWNTGCDCWETALSKLSAADFHRIVVIRGVELRVDAALHRSLAHFTYHVGQIVLLCRYFSQDSWQKLTVLSGSEESDSDKNAVVKW